MAGVEPKASPQNAVLAGLPTVPLARPKVSGISVRGQETRAQPKASGISVRRRKTRAQPQTQTYGNSRRATPRRRFYRSVVAVDLAAELTGCTPSMRPVGRGRSNSTGSAV